MAPALRGTDEAGVVDAVVEALRAGEVVLLPTDTVYGLAVDASNPAATARLFAVKERPGDVALPVLVADDGQAFGLAASVPPAARRLAAALWPGGLTLVLPRRADLLLDLGGHDRGTIGVRVPDHDLVREVARRLGAPVAATSANLHGRPTPEGFDEVLAGLGDAPDVALAVDGGPCAGAASSVVAVTSDAVTVLRQGRVPEATIQQLLA